MVSTLRRVAAPGLTVMTMELVPVTPGALNVKVVEPALVMNKPLKVATPLNGNALGGVRLPFRFPPVVCVAAIGEPNPLTVLPKASFTVTCGWVAKAMPAEAVAEGWVETISLLAVAGWTNSVCVAAASTGVVLVIVARPASVALKR